MTELSPDRYKQIADAISSLCTTSEKDIAAIVKCFTLVSLNKNEYFLREGQVCKKNLFFEQRHDQALLHYQS